MPTELAIDLSKRLLRVLAARVTGRKLRVHDVLVQPVPADLDVSDPQIAGRWLAQQLKAASIRRAPATFAISREDTVLKRVTLPTIERDELPTMTRIAVRRELPFDAEHAVIDFIPIAEDDTSTNVLAVAIPQTLHDYTNRLARAAGLKIRRTSLRSMGSAALLSTLGQLDELATLAIDITGDAVEFSVITEGTIRFSRAAELPATSDPRILAEAVITEARRTWSSFRVLDDASDVRRAIIMGDHRIAELAIQPLREILNNVPVRTLELHPSVDTRALEMSALWPLAGLLLEPSLNVPTIDFARPRRAPDFHARRRQQLIAAAGLLIVAGIGSWTLGNREYKKLTAHAADLRSKALGAVNEHNRFKRDTFKRDHIQAWQGVKVDWLSHLTLLRDLAPPPEDVVLDSFAGSLSFPGVRWVKNQWLAPREIKIALEGEARNRVLADTLRDSLVRDRRYTTSSTGADSQGGKRLPFSFNYQLRTIDSDPLGPELEAEATASLEESPASADSSPATDLPPSAAADPPVNPLSAARNNLPPIEDPVEPTALAQDDPEPAAEPTSPSGSPAPEPVQARDSDRAAPPKRDGGAP